MLLEKEEKKMKKELEKLSIAEAKSKLEEYKELAQLFNTKPGEVNFNSHPYILNKNYFIRTVTMAYTGKLIAIYPNELVLEMAAWIADTGRFATFLEKGEANEVEPFPDKCIVPRGSIVDISEFNHSLPRKQK